MDATTSLNWKVCSHHEQFSMPATPRMDSEMRSVISCRLQRKPRHFVRLLCDTKTHRNSDIGYRSRLQHRKASSI
jgi:hypothetical protein